MSNDTRDRQAVERVLGGDRDAFRELVERYEGQVYSLAHQILDNDSDAEEISQQTFVEAYQDLKLFNPGRRFSTWLMRVAVNNCKDFLKSHKRLETPLEQEVEGARAIFSGRIQSPDGALADGEFGLQVIRALERMDPRFRIPLLLKDVMGLSYKEMKQVLDQKIPTLKSRVIRARIKLRAVLARKNRR